jgi:hypothetical protein
MRSGSVFFVFDKKHVVIIMILFFLSGISGSAKQDTSVSPDKHEYTIAPAEDFESSLRMLNALSISNPGTSSLHILPGI